jgi:hypothetical protein
MKSGFSRLALLLSVASTAALFYPNAGRAGGEVHYGAPVHVGRRTMRTYLAIDGAGAPTELGVLLDAGALEGLPTEPTTSGRCFDMNGNGRIDAHGECEGDHEYVLAMPTVVADRVDIPVQWVGINWNVHGHAPPDVYDLPHFDFHFYMASEASIRRIRVGSCAFFIDCDDFKRATKPVPAKYVDSRHVNVDAAVAAMGNHLIDTTSPELAKPPKKFTHTWIFGAYDGRITFLEPMITREYLLSRPKTCAAIKQPEAWQLSGYYPTRYCMRYHDRVDKYTISMEGLVFRKAS